MRNPRNFIMIVTSLRCLVATLLLTSTALAEAPLFRDFVGVCGHTVTFKPELFRPVCRVVRDYHPVKWDLEGDTGRLPEWPFARNRVSWEHVYGSWQKAGLKIDVCLNIDDMAKDWKNPEADAEAYGASFAKEFGPGGRWPHVEWVEIGNEPGLYDDGSYRRLFRAMAKGIRAGNPKMKIATCNVEAEKSDRYWKGTEVFKDMGDLYDVLQIHRYAIAEQWPVWRRTYPENPAVPYLSSIRALIDWRNGNAAGKPVWVTEFGWDSSSKKPDPKGEWARWVGSTDEEQAMWLVRSFLLFSGMGVEKAFVYFHNDEDKPSLHAASGLTRNYQPKPAYHAVAWMLKSLENHRFLRPLSASLEQGYAYEFSPEKPGDPSIVAVWHATGEATIILEKEKRPVLRTERMPLGAEAAKSASVGTNADHGALAVPAMVHPTLIWLKN